METATQSLHRLTSYEPGRDWDEPVDDPRVLQDLETNDIERLPWFYKRYAEALPRIELPRELPATTAPAVAVLAGTAEIEPRELDLPQLSRLLHLAAGVVRTAERPYGTWLFRAAGSAGGRFPLELYVAVPEGGELPAGVHWYDPQAHALVQVGPPPRAGAPTIVVTGVPWRTGWRYRERGYRHTYWDAGTMLAQLLAAADSAGLEPALYTRFPDRAVTRARRRRRRARVAGRGGRSRRGAGARGDAGRPPPVRWTRHRSSFRSPPPRNGPATGTRSASRGSAARRSRCPSPARARSRRSSSRAARSGAWTRLRACPESVARSALAAAMRGIEHPHFVVVHAVDGLEPGIYRWPDLSAPVRAGDFRKELYRVALDQGLPRDAAFVVIGTADVSALDDREYREAQLAAGLVEGRLHLAAYALGAGASGMTFLDSEIPGLVGEPLDGLLFTCVGVPEYTSKAGGPPGAPNEIRMVTPRFDDE